MDLDELISHLQALKVKYPNGDFTVFLSVPGNGPCLVDAVSAEINEFKRRVSGRPQVIVTILAEDET